MVQEQAKTYDDAVRIGHQAVLMAESFASKFKPMSHEKPKCLFPIANIPLILFALEFLASNNVKEVIVVSSKETKTWKSI